MTTVSTKPGVVIKVTGARGKQGVDGDLSPAAQAQGEQYVIDAGAQAALADADRIAAEAAAAAAAASAASVPTGAGVEIDGIGPPGVNVGSAGAFYYDTAAGLMYGPKTATGWGIGIDVDRAAANTRTRYDMRYGGAFPSSLFTFARASVSTDFMYFDPPSYGPGTTFGVNVPMTRKDIGYGSFQQSKQFLTTTAAPANGAQTTSANVAVGVCILIAWGPPGSTATVTAGTAVISGTPAALDASAGGFQAITVTTAGTITVTCAGDVDFVNLQQCPGLPTISQPVPYISGAVTRSPDLALATSAGRDLFGAEGSFIASTNRVSPRTLVNTPSIIGINSTSALHAATATAPLGGYGVTIYDVGNHLLSSPNGGRNWATQEVHAGFTWDATATVTFGAGERFEATFPYQFNNAVAVTAVWLGVGKNTSYGDQSLNGFIQWIEFGSTRLSNEEFYKAYTQYAPPGLDVLLKNYTGVGQFRKFIAAYEQMLGGVREYVPVCVLGPSHEAGTGTGSNIRLNGWPPQLTALLEAEGIPATDDFIAGTDGTNYSAGTNAYDGRETYTGTAPTHSGNQFGGTVIVIPSGTTLTFTPGRETSKFVLGLYTAASGRGSAEVSIDGGTTAITPIEGGSATISTTGAAGLFQRTFNATLGANAWTVKAVGAPVHVSFRFAFNPLLKQLIIMNGGKSQWTVTLMSGNTTPENAYLLPLATLQPALSIGCEDMTNDMASGGTAWGTYSPALTAILTACLTTGDVLMFTDPPSRTGPIVPDDAFPGYSAAIQTTIWRYALAVAFAVGVPVYDFWSWKGANGYPGLFLAGFYGTDPVHMAKRGQYEGKALPMRDFIKRLIGFAG